MSALLDAGAAVSAECATVRRTPLHWAARNGHRACAHQLLKRGARHSVADAHGASPLHLCAAQGSVEVARLLLECGADVAAQRRGGFTPLHLAARAGNVHVAALLLDRGADVAAATHVRATRVRLDR